MRVDGRHLFSACFTAIDARLRRGIAGLMEFIKRGRVALRQELCILIQDGHRASQLCRVKSGSPELR
jgi:hypothetical protein